MSTLPGFTSRCTTPLRCAKASAAAISAPIRAACIGASGPSARMMSRSDSALHVLHDDEVRAVLLAPVVDADDVGVVEARGVLRLPAEPLDEARVAGELGEEHLDRDAAVELPVASEEDVGHAARRDRRSIS